MMLTQVELELETYSFGKERMEKSIARNEEKGGADNNPYAQAVYRRFVLPLAERIRADIDSPRIGRSQAHVPLLRAKYDPTRKNKREQPVSAEEQGREWYEAIAYVAVRGALTTCMRDKHGEGSDRDVLKAVGTNVYHEYLLTQFADAEPTLFYHLMNDMDRKLSVNENHRMTVMKMQGRKNGIEFKEWGQAQRDQVGAYLVDQLAQLGMLEVGVMNESKRIGTRNVARTVVRVVLTDEVRKLIMQISDFVVEATPYYLPCVEPPMDWTAIDNGGFHTTEMRRLNPWMVKTYAQTRDDYRAEEMVNEMQAINALQRVPWRINRRLMEAVSSIAKVHDMEEIISQGEMPKPRKPEWLTKDVTKELMSHQQEIEFKKWKRAMAEWHTDERLRQNKGNRFYNAMKVARKFAEYPSIYFVYFADFRGRKYVQTTGVSPQGSDLQKALLEFAEGKPLLTQDAKDWFCITGANRWGYDKATLPDRVKWVSVHHDQIMSFAADPVNNDEWKTADKPLQFLSWCMEYEQWQVFGDRFLSRIAVGMDGSCNGLQNFSAMLRDAVGGVATNLLPPRHPTDTPNDIYGLVAERVTAILTAEEEDADGFRTLWLEHGLSRTLVKRSVMTLPYGSKKSSWADFIVGDYLKEGKFPELDKALHGKAARFLSVRMGDAIADTVAAAAGAMAWLQRGSTAILGQGYDRIKWITPSGFPVTQVYWESEEHRINTKLCGNAKLSIRRSTDEVKKSRHRNGIAPNFVHSLDASHLTLVVNAAKAEGINAFAMIHDDFGTHAADSAALYRIIREVFVGMYERHDVLESFRSAYSFLPEPPPIGTLDLRQVLESPYFFS
jgi:DNA-directed RNA polymerase